MKDFLLLSNVNAITYKEFFPLLKEGKVNTGYVFNKTLEFETPEGQTKKQTGICWFTTFPVIHKHLVLTKTYNPQDYPQYDNYNAINVDKVKNIPYDYDGTMGVPITIFNYDLDNVEVVGSGSADCLPEGYSGMTKEFVDLYYSQGNTGSYKEGNRLEHYIKDGKAKIPYARVLIKTTNRS